MLFLVPHPLTLRPHRGNPPPPPGAPPAGAPGAPFSASPPLPVPGLLGSIAGPALAAMLGARIRTPRRLRDPVLAVLGLMIGSTLHAEAAASFARWPLTLAAVALYVIVVTATLYGFLRRFAGFDPVTAYFSAAPGGFMAMTVIGGAFGGQFEAGGDEMGIDPGRGAHCSSSRGMISTRLQGRGRVSGCHLRIPAQPSFNAAVEAGRADR